MVNVLKKYWIFLLIIVVMTNAVGYILITRDQPDMSTSTIETNTEKKEIEQEIEEIEELTFSYEGVEPIGNGNGNQIHLIHEHYNEVLTYGQWKAFENSSYSKWESETEYSKRIMMTIDDILEQVEDENLKTDLNHAKSLINIAVLHKDANALLYLHRIFHDLDIKHNRYSEKLWGYSYYKNKGNKVERVQSLIKKYEN